MESNNNNGNKSTDSDLGKIPGKEPNKKPDEPFLSSKEKKEKRKEQQRIYAWNRRRRIAEQEGRTLYANNLDHLTPREKRDRARQQSAD
jgi:hypothetical protein